MAMLTSHATVKQRLGWAFRRTAFDKITARVRGTQLAFDELSKGA